MKAGGSAAYSSHVGEEVQLFIVGTWGQGINSVGTWGHSATVGTWGQGAVRGSSCLQWVHEDRGSIHVLWGRGAATYSGYVGWVSS